MTHDTDLISRAAVLALPYRLSSSLDADDGYFVSVDAIRALPAAPVTVHVKPLVWEKHRDYGLHDAPSPLGWWYNIHETSGSRFEYQGDPAAGREGNPKMFTTIEAAKAAAQADYAARILAALDAQPRETMAYNDAEKAAEALKSGFATSDAEAAYCSDVQNACPHCGGSGHKGDVQPTPAQSPLEIRTAASNEAKEGWTLDIGRGCVVTKSGQVSVTYSVKAGLLEWAMSGRDIHVQPAPAPLTDVAALVDAVRSYIDRTEEYHVIATDRGGNHGPKGKAFIAVGDAYAAMRAALDRKGGA